MTTLSEGKVDKILKNIYYNLKNPYAYTSQSNVYRAVKKSHPQIKKVQVVKWFRKQLSATLHKPVRYRFPRNKTIVMNIDDQYQADLCDLTSIAKDNDGYKFILTVINCFSRLAFAIALKSKHGKVVSEALDTIFRQHVCKRFQSDKGTEFYNVHVQKVLDHYKIVRWGSENDDVKCAIVERFNRTLKSRMFKYFTAQNTRRYIEVLPSLVHGYNNTVHRSIKMAPANVTKKDQLRLRKILYSTQVAKKGYKYSIGDLVRISKARVVFRKGYLPNWTDEIFLVVDQHKIPQSVYTIQDYRGELIKGKFYEHELQRVENPDAFRVEKVIRTRIRAGKKEYLVKWFNFDHSANSWVKEKDLIV